MTNKDLRLNEKHQEFLIRQAMRVNLQAALAVEFYDTAKAGDLPEDLCKELTLMWFGVYSHQYMHVEDDDETAV